MLQTNERVVQRMHAWGFFIETQVLQFPGVKYDAGNVLMGHKARTNPMTGFEDMTQQMERMTFSIEQCGKDLGL